MNLLIKLLTTVTTATILSFFLGLIYLLVMGFVVSIFKLNQEKDSYWVFSSAYFLVFAFWIMIFVFMNFKKDKNDGDIFKSISVNGNIQSTHLLGRKEIANVANVKIVCWNLNTSQSICEISCDIEQPSGRKGYFAPNLVGKINSNGESAQIFESQDFSEYDDETFWSEFKSADIVLKKGKPIAIKFKHTKFLNDNWINIASWEAKF